MRRLEFVAPRRLEFREVTEPRIESDDQVIVRPVASTTCNLDRAIIAGAVEALVAHRVAPTDGGVGVQVC